LRTSSRLWRRHQPNITTTKNAMAAAVAMKSRTSGSRKTPMLSKRHASPRVPSRSGRPALRPAVVDSLAGGGYAGPIDQEIPQGRIAPMRSRRSTARAFAIAAGLLLAGSATFAQTLVPPKRTPLQQTE
jgi:hypothetical protein